MWIMAANEWDITQDRVAEQETVSEGERDFNSCLHSSLTSSFLLCSFQIQLAVRGVFMCLTSGLGRSKKECSKTALFDDPMVD